MLSKGKCIKCGSKMIDLDEEGDFHCISCGKIMMRGSVLPYVKDDCLPDSNRRVKTFKKKEK